MFLFSNRKESNDHAIRRKVRKPVVNTE